MDGRLLNKGMEPTTCTCPDPALCARLKRHINGRLWEIWNNVNIDPKTAQQYRDLWERQAKGGGEEAPTFRPRPTTKPRQPGGCNCGR